MNVEEKEKMLDLLCDKFVFGLSEADAKQLDNFGYDQKEAESIEKTIAALGLVGLDTESEMPAGLYARLSAAADDHFGVETAASSGMAEREIVLTSGPRFSWFSWLGWAAAAAACIALAISIYSPGKTNTIVAATPTPTPQQENADPSQQRQRLIDSSPGQVIMAEWSPGKMPDVVVSGDVVWNAVKQVGYIRLKGLPKNDISKETYQLWIVDGSQNPKTPIDGGTFDISSDGEVIVPINAKLKAIDPKAFAITVEKPGGVVVSEQGKLAALAPVKPAKV